MGPAGTNFKRNSSQIASIAPLHLSKESTIISSSEIGTGRTYEKHRSGPEVVRQHIVQQTWCKDNVILYPGGTSSLGETAHLCEDVFHCCRQRGCTVKQLAKANNFASQGSTAKSSLCTRLLHSTGIHKWPEPASLWHCQCKGARTPYSCQKQSLHPIPFLGPSSMLTVPVWISFATQSYSEREGE